MRDELARLFRDRVREAKPYVVGSSPGITCKLNQNENPENVSAEIRERLRTAISEVDLNRYPAEQPASLRSEIAEYAGVPEDSLLVTHGSNEFVHSLCIAFVEKGRKVLIPSPAFSLFRNSVKLFNGELIEIEADDSFDFPVESICAECVKHDPVLVIIPAPNNPTGRDLSIQQLEQIVLSSQGMVVVDEAYWEFTERPSAIELLAKYDNLIVMRTLSKAVGLAGLRVGYAIAHPDVIKELLKVRLPFMVSRIDAAIAKAVLKSPELIRHAARTLRDGQRQISAALAAMPAVQVVPSETNFVLFRTSRPSAEILSDLAKKGVLVRDMSGYPRLEGYLRVNAGTESENTAFLTALKEIVQNA